MKELPSPPAKKTDQNSRRVTEAPGGSNRPAASANAPVSGGRAATGVAPLAAAAVVNTSEAAAPESGGPSAGEAAGGNVASNAAGASNPDNARMRRKVTLAIAVAAIAAAGWFLWQQGRSHPSEVNVTAAIAATLGSAEFRVAEVHQDVSPLGSDAVRIAFRATVSCVDPLYSAVDAATYLKTEFKRDRAKLAKAQTLLASKAGPRLRELAGKAPADVSTLVLLKLATPAASTFAYAGTLSGRRGATGWEFQKLDASFRRAAPQGDPRPPAPPRSYVVGDAADRAALQAVMAAEEAYADQVIAARKTYEAELEQKREAVAATFQPGTIFAGTAKQGNESEAVTLEIGGLKSGLRQLTAELRNDGGWAEARRFEGKYDFDADDDTPAFTLQTRAQDAIRDGGPLLNRFDTWRLELRGDGTELNGKAGDYTFALKRLTAEAAAAKKQELAADYEAMLAATAPGKMYHGVAVSADHSQSYSYRLTFDKQDRANAIVRATLSSDARDDEKRAYHGTIVGNRYQAAGYPLRLESAPNARVASAPGQSPLGNGWNERQSFRLEGTNLVGQGDGFTWTLEAATAEYIAQSQQVKNDREQRLLGLVRPGASYVGYTQSTSGGVTEKVRIDFHRLEQRGALVEFTVGSLEVPHAHAEWRGTLDLYTGEIAASRMAVTPGRGLHSPLFNNGYSLLKLRIVFGDEAAEGAIENEPWRISFPLAGSIEPQGAPIAASVPENPSADVKPTAGATTKPADDFPRVPGAYVWTEGAWKPLPRNGAHVTYGAMQVLNNVSAILGALSGKALPQANDRTPDKLADLSFDGPEPVPTSDGTHVIIAYVGAIRPVSPDLAVKYPDLKQYPHIEMALTTTDALGVRKAPMYRIVPGVAGFRDSRVNAVVARVNGDVSTLTCTEPIGAGRYALEVNSEGYELVVR